MTSTMLSSVSSVRWRGEGRLFTIAGESIGCLIQRHTPTGTDFFRGFEGGWGLLAYLYQCWYELHDNAGACVGALTGSVDRSGPYAWAVDADGNEMASLAADLGSPSERRNEVHPLRFVLFKEGTAVGSMDPKMKKAFASGATEEALAIKKDRLRDRFTICRTAALPMHLVDTFTWFGLAAAICRHRLPLYQSRAGGFGDFGDFGDFGGDGGGD